MTLYLVRGLPGSGKSTLAHKLTSYVVEADSFFIINGVYQYNRMFIATAHKQCQLETRHHLRQGHSPAVANTFSERWEMSFYYQMQIPDLRIVEITVNVMATDEELAERCIHNVPVEVITKMRQRWEL